MVTKHYEPTSNAPNESAVDVAMRLAKGESPEQPDLNREQNEALRQAEAEPGGEPVDGAEPAPRAAAEEAPDPAAEDQDFAERVDSRQAKRNAIYEKKSAEHAAENARILAEPEPAAAEGEPLAPGEEALPAATRQIKVNREVRQVDEEEYQRLAQLGAAGIDQFEQQKQLTQMLRDTLARAANQGQDAPGRESSPTRDGTDQAESARAPTSADRVKLSDEQLKELHDKLLYGDEGEGIAALRQTIEAVAGANAPNPDELLDQLDVRRQERDARQEIMARAATAFDSKHPEIASDETGGLVFATVRRLHREVVAELQTAKLDPEQLRQAAADPDAAYHYHKDMRRQGVALTDPEVLSDRAAEYVKADFRKRFGAAMPPTTTANTPQPAPAPSREARIAEKEQMPMVRRAAISSQERRPAGEPAQRTPKAAVVGEYNERRLGPRSI